MQNNLGITPSIVIGGNVVTMAPNNKCVVINKKGKVKTFTQDQFTKQLLKNQDKAQSGQDFEFKKSNKAGWITAGLLAVGGTAAGLVYRKNISKFFKEFPFKEVGKDLKTKITNAFKLEKTPKPEA